MFQTLLIYTIAKTLFNKFLFQINLATQYHISRIHTFNQTICLFGHQIQTTIFTF